MAHEQPEASVEVDKEVERHEKGAAAFRGTYETARVFRDFERGWGDYEQKDRIPFGTLVSRVAERCENIASSAIRDNDIDPEFYEKEILPQIEEAEEWLVRFEERAGVSLFMEPIRGHLKTLKEKLKEGDLIELLKVAVSLRNYYIGFMQANEVLLSKADEASGDYNSVVDSQRMRASQKKRS